MPHGDAVHTHNGHDPFLRKHTHFANFPSFDVSATSDYIYDETGGLLSPKPPGSGRVKNPGEITAVDSRYDLPDARFLAEFRLLSKECRSEQKRWPTSFFNARPRRRFSAGMGLLGGRAIGAIPGFCRPPEVTVAASVSEKVRVGTCWM